MILKVVADDYEITLDIPETLIAEASDFFQRMDQDMDAGWQVGRDWIEKLDATHRCQVAADRLYTALRNENQAMVGLMAGFILARMPGVGLVEINTAGEPGDTRFLLN